MNTVIETVNNIFESRNITARNAVLDAAAGTCLWFCTEQDGFTYSVFLRGGKNVELRKFLGEFETDPAAGFGALPQGIQLDGTDGELFCAARYPADEQLTMCLDVFSETAHRLFSIAEASASKET